MAEKICKTVRGNRLRLTTKQTINARISAIKPSIADKQSFSNFLWALEILHQECSKPQQLKPMTNQVKLSTGVCKVVRNMVVTLVCYTYLVNLYGTLIYVISKAFITDLTRCTSIRAVLFQQHSRSLHSSLLSVFGLNATSTDDSYLPLIFGMFALI